MADVDREPWADDIGSSYIDGRYVGELQARQMRADTGNVILGMTNLGCEQVWRAARSAADSVDGPHREVVAPGRPGQSNWLHFWRKGQSTWDGAPGRRRPRRTGRFWLWLLAIQKRRLA